MNFIHDIQFKNLLLSLGFLMLALLATGFVLENGFGVLPCKMCWWQRYAHMAIAAFAFMGWASGYGRLASAGVLGASLAGLAIAVWQVAAQQGWLPFPPSCSSADAQALTTGADLLQAMANTKIIPCDKETFKLLGLSLAAWNVPVMLLAAGIGVKGLVYSK